MARWCPQMAGPRPLGAPHPARRLIAGLVAILGFLASLGPAGPANAATLDELRVALQVAEAGLDAAIAARAGAVEALEDAQAALDRVHEAVNASAAAAWMNVQPPAQADPAALAHLEAGVAEARAQIGLAEIDVARARRYFREVRAIVEDEEARQAAAQRTSTRTTTTKSASTIACPVAAPAAIYADFGAPRPGGPHAGIDIPAALGTPAVAAWYARVLETPLGGWMGKGVILEDGARNRWVYAHLDSIAVVPGEVVRRGQAIGRVGSTGNSTGSHLHFEIHAAGTTVIDPYPIISPACGISDPLGPSGRVAQESSTPEAGSG